MNFQCIPGLENTFKFFVDPRRIFLIARKVEDINFVIELFLKGLDKNKVQKWTQHPKKHMDRILFQLSSVRGRLNKPKITEA